MARSVATIQKQILDYMRADADLGPLLTSTSKRSIYNLLAFIVATCIAIFEQIIDVFQANIEAVIAKGAPSTPPWIQAKVFEFQYSNDVPQVIQLIDFAPVYPVIDPSLRIVTRCSVTSDLSNNVIVKVAKNEPPQALTADEVAALQSYIDIIGTAGITYSVRSDNPDRLYVEATVFYSGLYSSVIKANVITAINTYLSILPFNGNVKMTDLEAAITGVPGVTDVILQNVSARKDATDFADATPLILNNATISRLWPTQAGYIIGEDTAGQTLVDKLQFIPE